MTRYAVIDTTDIYSRTFYIPLQDGQTVDDIDSDDVDSGRYDEFLTDRRIIEGLGWFVSTHEDEDHDAQD